MMLFWVSLWNSGAKTHTHTHKQTFIIHRNNDVYVVSLKKSVIFFGCIKFFQQKKTYKNDYDHNEQI